MRGNFNKNFLKTSFFNRLMKSVISVNCKQSVVRNITFLESCFAKSL